MPEQMVVILPATCSECSLCIVMPGHYAYCNATGTVLLRANPPRYRFSSVKRDSPALTVLPENCPLRNGRLVLEKGKYAKA